MKHIFPLLSAVILMISCQQNDIPNIAGRECILELELACANKPSATTRAVEADLAVTILDADGKTYKFYHAGNVPDKIVLEPGTFTVRAYTDNQDSWKTGNGGKGEPCYYAEKNIVMEYDSRHKLSMEVPMLNYAVSLKLPELFHELFSSYTFTLNSGEREVTINDEEKAYFDIADEGFSYALSTINTDGVSHGHSAINFTDVESGKLYLLKYSYDSDATSGGIDIEISDDMGTDDTIVDL